MGSVLSFEGAMKTVRVVFPSYMYNKFTALAPLRENTHL